MNKFSKFLLLFLVGVFLIVGCSSTDRTNKQNAAQANERVKANIESDQATFNLHLVEDGLEHPWALDWLPDGRILITERPGRLYLYDGEDRQSLSGLPEIQSRNQGGLLDVKVHPNYENNGWIYFTYSSPRDGGTATTLARARIDGDSLVNVEELYVQSPAFVTARHYGSRIEFLSDNTVVFTIGDRGQRTPAQDTMNPAGSNIRLNDDGYIPEDNPFVDREGFLDEIYSYGHRNVQGMDLHPQTGRLWQAEHGPNGGDELNVIYPGENYGWPESTYGTEYTDNSPIGKTPDETPQFVAPLTHWSPTSIAPSGMAFYTGKKFDEWNGDIFVGALAKQHLRRIEVDGETVVDQEVLLNGTIGRIRDVLVGPDDFLYLLQDAPSAGLYRLEPKGR
ncbi:MAG: PQQ-dependent sugar dehydrogenase [bacterium]